MLTIRRAVDDDACAIARVHIESWRSTYRGIVADEFLDSLSEVDHTRRWSDLLQHAEPEVTLVAEVEGHGIVGFTNGGPERDGRDDYRGELYSIYLTAGWQRKGVGTRLVAAFARWLIDCKFNSMLVWVLEGNPFRSFYQRLGGKVVGKKTITISGRQLDEVAYGWDDVGLLIPFGAANGA